MEVQGRWQAAARGGPQGSRGRKQIESYCGAAECGVAHRKRDYVSMGKGGGGWERRGSGVGVTEVAVIHNSDKKRLRSAGVMPLSIMNRTVSSWAHIVRDEQTTSRKAVVSGEEVMRQKDFQRRLRGSC